MSTTPDPYTENELNKWRRLLLVRDSRVINPRHPAEYQLRMGVCALCGPNIFFQTSMLQAHHIYPKALYPEKALLLRNGVMCCAAHHQGIVHNFNPTDDVANKEWDSGWRNWLVFFQRWNDLADNRKFNDDNQSRIR